MEKKDSEYLRVFDGTKFPVWKFYMELCFSTKKIMPIVNGTLPKPDADAPELEKAAWEERDNLAKQLIGSSVTMQILESLVNCETAAAMWSTLCSFYQRKSKENIQSIQNSFFEYKMTIGDDINTHINKILSIANLLKDLGKPLDEDMIITKIMCSLPASYNSIVTAWANVPEEHQTIANLKVRLLQLEHLLTKQNGEPAGDSAFFARSSKASLHNNKKHTHENAKIYIKELKSRTRCYNCGELDHWTAECPHPRQDKTKHSNRLKGRSDRNQKHAKGHRSEACVATTEQVHSDSSNSPSDSENDSCAFTVVSKQSHAYSVNLDKKAWFADSGATEHMTEHRHWFTTFKPIPPGTWSVTVADDRNLWVQGIGDILITRTVDGIHKKGVLQKVLYIPELRRNLFSIGLASKAGLSFQTLGEKCALFQDLGKGPKVMEGVQTGTLYKLSIDPIPPSSSEIGSESEQQLSTVLATTSASDTDSTSKMEQNTCTALITTNRSDADFVLWHNRMGHVNSQVLKNMSTHESLQDFTIQFDGKPSSICRGCALGKQHKASYPVDTFKERSKVPGELLHADLCGKMSQPSLGGAHYYLLIKDDCTSYRFVSFLKAKGEAIRFFLKVIRYIERTTGNRTKTLRTDRGGEFCSTEFDLLLEREGVVCETSMPYTPQQNGYVERDNRTICEAARSMLHLHDLPLKLWVTILFTLRFIS